VFKILLFALAAAYRSRRQFAIENLAQRHQLEVLQRTARRPRLRRADRALWGWISKSLGGGKRRLGWRLKRQRKSRRRRPDRPFVEAEVCELIHRLSAENPLWGAPRIYSELLKLRYDAAEARLVHPLRLL